MHTVPDRRGIERRSAKVAAEEAGQRLDVWLAGKFTDFSRAQLQRLIAAGEVRLCGEPVSEARRKIKAADVYEIAIPEPEESTARAEKIPLTIVYEDKDVIVIDKPAGLVVHPAAGHASGTLVNALIAHCGESLSGIGGVKRPGIVHRLDKDTSGLLVVAKNDAAHQSLSEQFKSHGADGRLKRVYRALCWGVPAAKRGTIDAPLQRSATNRTKIAVARGLSGRRAVTHYQVLEVFQGKNSKDVAALLELELETGRTHQIRVHLAHVGHPVLGDATYGAGFKTRRALLPELAAEALESLDRQALHAAHLAFDHPRSGKHVAFDSPLPKEIQKLIAALRK